MIFFKILFFTLVCQARPVAFYESTSVMNENRFNQSELMISRTFLPEWSAGIHYSEIRNTGEKQKYYYALLSYLPVRKNWEKWQGNIYLTSGLGLLNQSRNQKKSAYAAFESDIESRKYYYSLKAEAYHLNDHPVSSFYRLRSGFAPYLSEVNGLHTFVLLELSYFSWIKNHDLTPMLRFFYQNILFELGVSLKGHGQFNFTTEF